LALRVSDGKRRSSSLLARKVGDMLVQVYASPAYLARRGAPRRPRDLGAYDWVSFAGPRALSRLLDHRDLRTIEPRVTCPDAFFAREVLRTGGGVGLLPAFLADADLAAGTLVRVLPRWLLRTGTIYVVQPAGAHRPRRVTAFVELLLELLRQRPLPAAVRA
jgi:DNA-binding transcriptional LysR family regulator